MPEYLSPGVYVEEVETGAMAIEGVSTSTAGFLGRTERGPVEPQYLTSFAEFKRLFGGFAKYRRNQPLEGTNLAYAVDGFFRNGGSRCYVGRITAATGTADLGLGAYTPPMELVADADGVDFDRVVTGRTVTETVELRNAGIENDPEIELSSVSIEGGPGDTPGEFDVLLPGGESTPITLTPGEPLLVEVVYQPTADTGHTATLTVDHDGADPPLELRVTGQGVAPADAAELAVSPMAVDYGTVPKDTAIPETVTVANDGIAGADPVRITGVGKSGANAGAFRIENAAAFNPAELTVDGDPESIEVSVDHGTAGRVDAILEISVDGQPNPTEVDLRADVVEPENTLGSSAIEVAFDELVTGTSADETVALRNMGGSGDNKLTVTGVSTSGATAFSAGLTADTTPLELDPGEATPLRIGFAPTSPGSPTGTVSVAYDDGTGGQTLEIDVSGSAVDVAGEYAATPPAARDLDYGEVVVGESATRTVVVENAAPAGGGDVTVDAVEITNDGDDEYALPEDLVPDDPTQPVATLGPGESRTVGVTVTPEGEGLVDADLEITYTNGTSGTDTYGLTASAVESMTGIEAVGPGDWGGRVAVTVRNGARTNEVFGVTVRYWSDLDVPGGTVAQQGDPDVEETFSELTTEEASSNYYETVINSGSNLIEVERLGGERPDNGTTFLQVPPASSGDGGGDDGVGLTHYTGSEDAPRGERTGLAGFAEIDDISIVTVPDENSVTGLTGEVVSHCQNRGDRFAVLQAEQGADPGSLPPGPAISEYSAIYYPHIRIIDPETGVRKLVPPGGHVAGIYARSDAEHGVHKAPANETVRGAVELEFPVTKADQARLNPKGVNAIRSFPGRGIRVWGARTTSSNPQWKYVNVRRLFLYIEESIDEGTQWAVFESNNEKLWARVRQSVRNFLTTVWRNGGLAGSTPEEAFYVKADRTTMTQTQIDNGQLIVEIGVAPVKPAEFVIFRITQWTEGVEGGS